MESSLQAALQRSRRSDGMCCCSVGCPDSPYADSGYWRGQWCGCWCHRKRYEELAVLEESRLNQGEHMTRDEAMKLEGNNPVLLKDGRRGLLIRFPDPDGLCGVQVFGEEDIRRIHHDQLIDVGGGALKELA